MQLSKSMHIGGLVGTALFSVVARLFSLGMGIYIQNNPHAPSTAQIQYALGFIDVLALLTMIGAIGLFLHWIWKLWEALPSDSRQHSPAAASLLMLIPFWNFYWVFQAVWGWAKQYNAYIDQQGLSLKNTNDGLALAVAILFIFSFIPFLNFIASPALLIVLIIFINNSIDAVHRLQASHISTETVEPDADETT